MERDSRGHSRVVEKGIPDTQSAKWFRRIPKALRRYFIPLRFALHFYVDSHTRSYTDKHRQLEEKVSRPRWTTVDESGPNN